MILSILIPTIEKRNGSLARLMYILAPQRIPEIEVLIELDKGENNGGMVTGMKRNLLLDRAKGDYIAFVDDDDRVSEDYVSFIIIAIAEGFRRFTKGADVIAINGLQIEAGSTRKFTHAIRYDKWFKHREHWYRFPNHLNPVKREHAVATRFPLKSFGEDFDYAKRLRPLLKNEVEIKEPIYFYEYDRTKTY